VRKIIIINTDKGDLGVALFFHLQVEGAAREGGKGPSIWDTFTHQPGKLNQIVLCFEHVFHSSFCNGIQDQKTKHISKPGLYTCYLRYHCIVKN